MASDLHSIAFDCCVHTEGEQDHSYFIVVQEKDSVDHLMAMAAQKHLLRFNRDVVPGPPYVISPIDDTRHPVAISKCGENPQFLENLGFINSSIFSEEYLPVHTDVVAKKEQWNVRY